jgi:outer membrane protein OmpA-like peptidoglycan-associated protein
MQHLLRKTLPIIALGSICLLAAACHRNPYTEQAQPDFKQSSKELNYLSQQDVHIIDLGQTVRLTFPSNQFFFGSSTTLNPNKTLVLQQVAAYASSYPHAKITLIGYSDNVLPNHEAKANSLAQAEAIAGFLWNDGLPSTRMHVVGKGYVAPINSADSPKAGSENRRVEMFIAPA